MDRTVSSQYASSCVNSNISKRCQIQYGPVEIIRHTAILFLFLWWTGKDGRHRVNGDVVIFTNYLYAKQVKRDEA